MRRFLIAAGAAALLVIAVVATAAAAGPHGRGTAAAGGTPQADVAADILGLSREAIADLRQDGLSLAQIAEQQKVDPQKLVDAFMAQWSERIQARVEVGALTADQAKALTERVQTVARDMVYRTTLGGMRGAAVGAGPDNAPGAGERAMDGTGFRGANRGAGAGPADGSGFRGAGRGAGTGVCDGTGQQAQP